MNCSYAVSGVASASLSPEERELLLRKAHTYIKEPLRVDHPLPFLSIAVAGTPLLVSTVETAQYYCLLYGACYASDMQEPGTVEDKKRYMEHMHAMYMQEPQQFLCGLHGTFIAIYIDKQSATMFAGADNTRKRTIYYGKTETYAAFSGSLLVCARMCGTNTIDRSYEDFFLEYGFYPMEKTQYHDISSLPVSTVLSLTETTYQLHDSSPPALQTMSKPIDSKEQCHRELYESLTTALEHQHTLDTDVGVLLGGFDSALVASLLCRMGKTVHTYSFRYQDVRYNQPYVDMLTQALPIRHTWVDIDQNRIGEDMHDFAEIAPKPSNVIHYILQVAYVCNAMKDRGIRIAYSGEGCDEFFLGSPGTYGRTKLFSKLPRLPTAFTNACLTLSIHRRLDYYFGHFYRVLLGMLRATSLNMPEKAFLTFRILDPISIASVRKDHPVQMQTSTDIARMLASKHRNAQTDTLGHIATKLRSPLHAKHCAAMDTSGVHMYSPYFHPLVRTCTERIPKTWLTNKQCLVDMAKHYKLLPEIIIDQKKIPAVCSPIDSWLCNELYDTTMKLFNDLPFPARKTYLQRLLKNGMVESLYRRWVSPSSVVKDAALLLASYASCTRCVRKPTDVMHR